MHTVEEEVGDDDDDDINRTGEHSGILYVTRIDFFFKMSFRWERG